MFRFELETVLSLKEKFEDSKKRELGVATVQEEKLQVEKQTLLTKKSYVYDAIKEASSECLDINSIKLFNRYSSVLNEEIQKKEVEILNAKKVVEEKRRQLFEAVKERKILENLKEIKFEQYREEANRAENQILDEIVSYKYGVVKRGDH